MAQKRKRGQNLFGFARPLIRPLDFLFALILSSLFVASYYFWRQIIMELDIRLLVVAIFLIPTYIIVTGYNRRYTK